MKSKNIPADIGVKSIKEAQNEIKDSDFDNSKKPMGKDK